MQNQGESSEQMEENPQGHSSPIMADIGNKMYIRTNPWLLPSGKAQITLDLCSYTL
jgi:hypothetical protein